MLTIIENGVRLEVLHDRADNDVLHELAYDTRQGDWPVVGRVILLSFLEDWCNECTPPVSWHDT